MRYVRLLAILATGVPPCDTSLRLARRQVVAGSVAGCSACLTPALGAFAVSRADVDYAYADLVACRAAFDTVYRLLLASDFEDAAPLLTRPPIARFGRSIQELTLGPGLDAQAASAIGEVLPAVDRSLTELAKAIEAQDVKSGRAAARTARTALDEILGLCESLRP
eukprot:4435201-Prymnesium_polylepis.1